MPGDEFTAIYTDILLLHRLCKAALTLAVSKVVRSALTKSQLCGRHDQIAYLDMLLIRRNVSDVKGCRMASKCHY